MFHTDFRLWRKSLQPSGWASSFWGAEFISGTPKHNLLIAKAIESAIKRIVI